VSVKQDVTVHFSWGVPPDLVLFPEYSRLLLPDRMAASETLIGDGAIGLGCRLAHELPRARIVFDGISE
jgi:hypothetical protein